MLHFNRHLYSIAVTFIAFSLTSAFTPRFCLLTEQRVNRGDDDTYSSRNKLLLQTGAISNEKITNNSNDADFSYGKTVDKCIRSSPTRRNVSEERDSSRRQFFTSLTQKGRSTTTAMAFMAFVSSTNPNIAMATEEETQPKQEISTLSPSKNRKILHGTINLPPSSTNSSGSNIIPEDISTSALYITARPNNAVDVPRAILDGSNGKAPPVLAARFPNVVTFPYEFELSLNDLTLEGSSKLESTTTASAADDNDDLYWWEGKDLIVSARWDTDGIAATRSPTDLVGRGLYTVGKSSSEEVTNNSNVSIQLQGRGFTGKLITGGNQKK